MLRFAIRPGEGRQAYEDKVRGHVEALEQKTIADGSPDYAAINAYIKGHQAWKKGVKEHFAEAQGRKCGYCERMLTDYGDVEHYRPKSAIYKLDSPGTEVAGLSNVKDRSFAAPPEAGTYDSGYWWLAYDWDNYLVSCGICNQAWKNALFPVRHGHRRRPRPGDELEKRPYLLDPFGPEEPGDHLEFTAGGAIRPRDNSRFGRETIAVCGLDRPSVVAARLEKAQKIHRKLRQLREAPDDPASMRPILEEIADLGDERWAHAGMVRIIFSQATGWTWADLQAWLQA